MRSRVTILVAAAESASEARCEAAPQVHNRVFLLRRPCKKRSRPTADPQALHDPSTGFPHPVAAAPRPRTKLPHNRANMPARALLVVALAAALGVSPLIGAQAGDPGAVFRIFLTTRQPLPSDGGTALIVEGVLFPLMVGDGSAATQYQVVSLPSKSVDLFRSGHYATTIRAARYAATRGETDYAE